MCCRPTDSIEFIQAGGEGFEKLEDIISRATQLKYAYHVKFVSKTSLTVSYYDIVKESLLYQCFFGDGFVFLV